MRRALSAVPWREVALSRTLFYLLGWSQRLGGEGGLVAGFQSTELPAYCLVLVALRVVSNFAVVSLFQ